MALLNGLSRAALLCSIGLTFVSATACKKAAEPCDEDYENEGFTRATDGDECPEDCDEDDDAWDDALGCVAVEDVCDVDGDPGEFFNWDPEEMKCEENEPPPTWDPVYFMSQSQFGYDATNDQARPYVANDGTSDTTVNPTLAVTLASEDYTIAFDDSLTCIVIMDTAAPQPLASWAGDAGVFFGWDMPSDATVQTDCDQQPTDADIWGDPFVDAITQWVWGAGIGPMPSNITSDFKGQIDSDPSSDWAVDIEPYFVGGGFALNALAGQDGFPGGYADANVTRGFAVDTADNFKIVNDTDGEPLQLTKTDMSDGTLPDGAYIVFTFYLYGGADQLLPGR